MNVSMYCVNAHACTHCLIHTHTHMYSEDMGPNNTCVKKQPGVAFCENTREQAANNIADKLDTM